MKWIFSTELTNENDAVTIYFFHEIRNEEPFIQALPYPKGVIAPFSMKYDAGTHEFRIMESQIPVIVKEYELIFSEAILNLKDLGTEKLRADLILN